MKCGVAVIASGIAVFGHAEAGALSDTGSDNLRNLILLSGFAASAYQRDTEGLSQLGTSLVLTSGITLAAKKLVDSERPNGLDNDSFPSGHAATAFAGAGFLHRRYGLQWGLPAYLAATSVAWSRVDKDHHRLTDVAAGALIALVVNQRLVSLQQSPQPRLQQRLQPNLSPAGLSLEWHFRF